MNESDFETGAGEAPADVSKSRWPACCLPLVIAGTFGLPIFAVSALFFFYPGPAPLRKFRAPGWKPVDLVRFSPDGSQLATQWSYDHFVEIWDPATGQHLRTLPVDGKPPWLDRSKPRSRDRSIAAEPLQTEHFPNREVRVFDPTTNATIAIFEADPHHLRAIAITPDGALLVTGGGYGDHPWPINPAGEARIWNPRNGKLLGRLRRHWGAVSDVDISPDGNTLATSSDDGTVMLWDLTRYRQR